jgi:exodeoxyribonuclease V beta subunit
MSFADHPVFKTDLNAVSFIEASAGTGKTWTLSALYVRAVLEAPYLTVEQIAVVTFTKTAAAELKQRIEMRLQLTLTGLEAKVLGAPLPKAVSDDPFLATYLNSIAQHQCTNLAQRVELALASADQMQIGTINGLFQYWLRRGYGVNPFHEDIELLGSTVQLERLVIDEFLLALFEQQPACAQWFAQNPNAFKGAAGKSHLGLLHQALQHSLLPSQFDGPSSQTVLTQWRELLTFGAQFSADQWVDLFRHSAKLPYVKKARFPERYWSKWAAELVALFQHESFSPSKAAREVLMRAGWADLELFNKEALQLPEPTLPAIHAARQMFLALSLIDSLPLAISYECRQSCLSRLFELKQQRRVMSYDDQVSWLHDGLIGSAEAAARAQDLRSQYPLALVDETQDTDETMWAILFALYGAGGLVAVGDPKQSIYAFRGADVDAYFLAKAHAAKCLTLAENQRSTANLITAVNHLFSTPTAFVHPKIEMIPVSKGLMPVDDLNWNTPQCKSLRAMNFWLAQPIKTKRNRTQAALQWTVEQVGLALRLNCESGNALLPHDVAILVNTNTEAKSVKQALALAGFAAVEASKARVIDSNEADELLLIFTAAAALDQPAVLLAAMTTRLWGLQTSDCNQPGARIAAVDQARQLLLQTQLRWTRWGAFAALTWLLDQLGSRIRLSWLIDGARRLTNLEHLVDLISGTTEANQSVAQARAWLEGVRESDDNQAAELFELRLESDGNLIQILTIHKSKGLEFKVVLLPFAWSFSSKRFNQKGPLRYLDQKRAASFLDFNWVNESPDPRVVEKVLSEGARRLYVALTRAKLLCSALLFNDSLSEKNSEKFSDHADLLLLMQKHFRNRHPGARGESIEQWVRASVSDQDPVLALHQWQVTEQIPVSAFDMLDVALARDQIQAAVQVKDVRPYWASKWSVNSFTSIARVQKTINDLSVDSAGDFLARDHENALQPMTESEIVTLGASNLLGVRASFPVGKVASAVAGVCLHEAFEKHAFERAFDAAYVQSVLQRYGLQDEARATCDWLNEVTSAPLSLLDGASLKQVSHEQVYNELEFMLSSRTAPQKLAAILAECLAAIHGVSVPVNLEAIAIDGFIRGFIDSVFCFQEKWYLVDWKSNFLGLSLGDYSGASLNAAMLHHQYSLQAIIYSVALHRWLKSALQDYQFSKHFGAAGYLFVRAVGANTEYSDAGVWHWRPTERIMTLLDEGFGQ